MEAKAKSSKTEVPASFGDLDLIDMGYILPKYNQNFNR